MMMWLQRRGVSGLIIDGCIRDIEAVREMNFPVFATGINPNGPVKEGGGEINFPIMCGGIAVNPGDIVIGDQDGVVVVNPADAPVVLEKAKAQNAKEASIMEDIKNLAWDRAWVDATLKAKGCEFID